MHTEYAYCVGRERKGKMARLHSRRIHSEQRSFAFTVGERRLGGRRTWRRSGEQQHPARISAAATGDSAGKVRPLLPRLAWLVPVLLALGRRCSSSRWGWRLEESRGVMEGGGGGRWAPTLPRSGAASLFYWPLRGEHPLGLGGVISVQREILERHGIRGPTPPSS